MILIWLIVIPIVGGVFAWLLERLNSTWPRYPALLAMLIDLALAAWLAFAGASPSGSAEAGAVGPWLVEIRLPWIPRLGADFFLAADGLSLVLILLTAFLGIMAVASAWTEITERTGFFLLQPDAGARWNSGRLRGSGSLPVLPVLGTDADTHVLHNCHMGP